LENYIVRIYRRDSGNPFEIAGIVESVEDENKDIDTDKKTDTDKKGTKK